MLDQLTSLAASLQVINIPFLVRRHYSAVVTLFFKSPVGDFSSGHMLTTFNIHLLSESVDENGIKVALGERRNPMILSSKTCLRYRSSAVHAG